MEETMKHNEYIAFCDSIKPQFWVYEGETLVAAQSSFYGALKYYKPGRLVVTQPRKQSWLLNVHVATRWRIGVLLVVPVFATAVFVIVEHSNHGENSH